MGSDGREEDKGVHTAHLRDGWQRALELPQEQLARREQVASLRRAQRRKHRVSLHLWLGMYCIHMGMHMGVLDLQN